jgi:HlyD family secretion protein
LLRIDNRPAHFQLREAEERLKAARLRLNEARKLPQEHKVRLAAQQQAIKAARFRASAARNALTLKKKLLAKDQLAGEEAAAADDLFKQLETAVQVEEEKLHELELHDPSIDVARAESDVAAKQIALDHARYLLEECSLRAPADGKILRVLISEGDVLGGQAQRQPAVEFCPEAPRSMARQGGPCLGLVHAPPLHHSRAAPGERRADPGVHH